jgi:hypothetical protein
LTRRPRGPRDSSYRGGRGRSRAQRSAQAGLRFAGAISGPLTSVTRGLSRSLADTSPRRSGHVTGPDGTDSQADSAGSIPVTRSKRENPASARFAEHGSRVVTKLHRCLVPAACPIGCARLRLAC